MIGLIVLAVVVVYIAFWWFAFKRVGRWWQKTAVVLVALAIPFWEVPIGYTNLLIHCSSEGGVRVSKSLKPVDSILMDPSAAYAPEQIFGFGFKAAEYIREGKTFRYVPSPKGRSSSVHEAPISTVKVHSSGRRALPWKLMRWDYFVSDIKTGEVLASATTFRWGGLWWQELASPLLGDGTYCPGGEAKPMLAIVAGKP